MRIEAAESELVRTGDKSLAQKAPEVRTKFLDGADAPNTIPSDGLAAPIEAEVAKDWENSRPRLTT